MFQSVSWGKSGLRRRSWPGLAGCLAGEQTDGQTDGQNG